MDEARRFVRYVFPGLSALALFAVLAYLSDPSKVVQWYSISTKETSGALGAALGVLLGSGVIGYLLSVVHHILSWSIYSRCARCLITNHVNLIKGAAKRRDLAFVDHDGTTYEPPERLRPHVAWILVTAIWHSEAGTAEPNVLAQAKDRTESLFDIMHGAGTLLVGSAVAVLFWALFALPGGLCWADLRSIGVSVIVIIALTCNLANVTAMATGVTGTILSTYLRNCGGQYKPVTVAIDRKWFDLIPKKPMVPVGGGTEERTMDNLLERLRQLYKTEPKALEALYAAETAWAQHFNGFIWKSAAIILPVSFAGLSLFKVLDATAFILVAVGSALLLWFWHFIAQGHRGLWKRRLRVTDRIEVVWGIRGENELERPLTPDPANHWSVSKTRLVLVIVGTVTWALAIVIKFLTPAIATAQ